MVAEGETPYVALGDSRANRESVKDVRYVRVDEEEGCCACIGRSIGQIITAIFRKVFKFLAIILAVLIAIQWGTDYYMSYGCGSVQGVTFPATTLLVQEAPFSYGPVFAIFPSDDQDRVAGTTFAYVSKWSGPFSYNIAVSTAQSGQTWVVARSPFFSFSNSLEITDCLDMSTYLLNEGSENWVFNLFRKWYGSYTHTEYTLYKNVRSDVSRSPLWEQIATSRHSGYDVDSLDVSGPDFRTESVLIDRHFHGNLDEWFVKSANASSHMSFLGPVITANRAFHVAEKKEQNLLDRIQAESIRNLDRLKAESAKYGAAGHSGPPSPALRASANATEKTEEKTADAKDSAEKKTTEKTAVTKQDGNASRAQVTTVAMTTTTKAAGWFGDGGGWKDGANATHDEVSAHTALVAETQQAKEEVKEEAKEQHI